MHSVRRPGIDLEGAVADEIDRLVRCSVDGHDLIIVAVRDQDRHVEGVEVFGEVGL